MNTISKILTMGFTPCPNDTFMFYGLVHKALPCDLQFIIELKDIEELNLCSLTRTYDISKLSSFAYGKVANEYVILRSGAALGWGCGPLLLAAKGKTLGKNSVIAVPGLHTTAHLLLKLFLGANVKIKVMSFDQIMPAMKRGEIDFGLVIHEGRFTYQEYDFSLIQDLGVFWEQCFDLPIPLGIICARRSLGKEMISHLENKIRQSICYAREHWDVVLPYSKQHAQELQDDVIKNHISLYVTKESEWLSDQGKKAIELLFEKAMQFNLINSLAIQDSFIS